LLQVIINSVTTVFIHC